jgi:hypothetical protein
MTISKNSKKGLPFLSDFKSCYKLPPKLNTALLDSMSKLKIDASSKEEETLYELYSDDEETKGVPNRSSQQLANSYIGDQSKMEFYFLCKYEYDIDREASEIRVKAI